MVRHTKPIITIFVLLISFMFVTSAEAFLFKKRQPRMDADVYEFDGYRIELYDTRCFDRLVVDVVSIAESEKFLRFTPVKHYEFRQNVISKFQTIVREQCPLTKTISFRKNRSRGSFIDISTTEDLKSEQSFIAKPSESQYAIHKPNHSLVIYPGRSKEEFENGYDPCKNYSSSWIAEYSVSQDFVLSREHLLRTIPWQELYKKAESLHCTGKHGAIKKDRWAFHIDVYVKGVYVSSTRTLLTEDEELKKRSASIKPFIKLYIHKPYHENYGNMDNHSQWVRFSYLVQESRPHYPDPSIEESGSIERYAAYLERGRKTRYELSRAKEREAERQQYQANLKKRYGVELKSKKLVAYLSNDRKGILRGNTNANGKIMRGEFFRERGGMLAAFLYANSVQCTTAPGYVKHEIVWRDMKTGEKVEDTDHVIYIPRQLKPIYDKYLRLGYIDWNLILNRSSLRTQLLLKTSRYKRFVTGSTYHYTSDDTYALIEKHGCNQGPLRDFAQRFIATESIPNAKNSIEGIFSYKY